MTRLLAFVIILAAVLGVAWFVWQSSHEAAAWVLVFGGFFLVLPALESVLKDRSHG